MIYPFRHPASSASKLLPLLALAWLTGCVKVGPEYVAPSARLPDAWHHQDPALLPELPGAVSWWSQLHDPLLDQLLAQAGQGNLSIKGAVARIDESRALYGVASGMKMPGVGTGADISRGKSAGVTANLFSLGAQIDYEIDLFGRVRRTLEAAAGELGASEEDAKDVMIALYGDVALRYLEIRTLQEQIHAAEDAISAQVEALRLVKVRARLGLASELDVAKGERELALLRIVLPGLRIALQQARSALTLLLGEPPGALDARLAEVKPIPLPPATATIGLPRDLARQRPDIRAAERRLAAQTARIGIAVADLYPSFSLSGSLGAGATKADQLFKSDSRTWGVGLSVRQAIFAGGRLRNLVEVEKFRTEQALLAYEQTVLDALHQVDNAAEAWTENRLAEAEIERALEATERSLALARKRFEDGLVDFQEILDNLAAKSQLESDRAAARGASAASFVNLYRAIGGSGLSPNQPVAPAVE